MDYEHQSALGQLRIKRGQDMVPDITESETRDESHDDTAAARPMMEVTGSGTHGPAEVGIHHVGLRGIAVADGIATVTLNAPQRRNALTPQMAADFVGVLDPLDRDTSIGAVVLTAAGKGFCAGADLSTLGAAGDDPLADDNYDGLASIHAAFSRLGAVGPDDRRVRGAAVGAGSATSASLTPSGRPVPGSDRCPAATSRLSRRWTP